MKDFTHTFMGELFEVIVERHDGLCSYGNSISFPNGLPKTKKSLMLAVHESLHACFPDLSEQDVTNASKDIAAFLWRVFFKK